MTLPSPPNEVDTQLAEFDAANSPDGLMMRYAKGRVTHFMNRQILTLIGTASLIWIVSPLVGAIAIALALLGELVDCALLRKLPDWRAQGVPLHRLRCMATVSGAFQGLTIAACVSVAWATAPDGQAAFFCVAYLWGAALNAGIVLPYFPPAAWARLMIYGTTAATAYISELLTAPALLPSHGYDFMALMIVAYLVYVFIAFVIQTHMRNRHRSRALLVQQNDLAEATQSLAAREREARHLSLIARTARDSIFLTDKSGGITWVNDAFRASTGYSLEDVLGRHPGAVLNGPETDPATIAKIRRHLHRGQSVRAEILNYTKDGRKIWVETHIVPIPADDCGEEMYVSVERDITEAKESARRLAKATENAQAANRAKSEFLATMSHEIRTPMNGVLGMADLLSDTPLNKDQRLYATTIQSSAKALLTIINDILDLSRLEAGRMTIDPTPTPLRKSIEDVVTVLSPLARSKNLDIGFDVDPALPPVGLTDSGRLRQILMNLGSNAIKFTENGRVDFVARPVELAAGPGVSISVNDTGIGIARDKLADVFDAFQQEDGTIARRFGGTGLGLTISRRLAQLLGGDITATSVHGRGSCFTATLTFPSTEISAPPPELSQNDVLAKFDAPAKILVAEDNHTNRLLIDRYLRNAPCDVSFANDGAAAVRHTLEENPDLIFMDMSMPGMDGLEATRAIRASSLPNQPRIVALTANAFDEDRRACLDAGMDGFLSKPVSKADLMAQILSLSDKIAAE